MDLGLNIVDMKRAGRPAKPLTAEIVRPLNEADRELALTVERHSKPPEIKRLSDRHHALARLLASGTPEGEAAMILNYDVSRVSILKNSPAFQELLRLYRREVDQQFATTLDHMAGMTRDALMELRDRIEEEPEKFSNNELLRIVTEMADRAEVDGGDAKLPTRIEIVAGGQDEQDGQA
jgi:hypothetical protein